MPDYTLFLVGGDDDEQITLHTETVGNACRLIGHFRAQSIAVEATDYFGALQTLRRRVLEPKGLIPFCYGASLDVWPSGMSRDMGLGLRAYRIKLGEPGGRSVDIFSEGPDVIPASVAAQEEFARDWIASLKR